MHDIPIGVVNACLYQNVDRLGLWEEGEENKKNKGIIRNNHQNVEERKERVEPDIGSKIKIVIVSLVVIFIIIVPDYSKFFEFFEWLFQNDSSLDDL